MTSQETLKQQIKNAPKIDFGDLFNESVELFKKVWVYGLLLQLLSLILSLPITLSTYAPVFGEDWQEIVTGNIDPDYINQMLANNSESNGLLYFLMVLVVNFVSYVLFFGFYRIIKRLDYGDSVVFADFFYYFKQGSLGKIILLILSHLVIGFIAVLLCVLPIFYVLVPLMFVVPVFAFNSNKPVLDILKLAFLVGHKKWGITFIITLLNIILILVLAVLTCGLGILFFSSFVYLPIYIIYKKVVGFDAAA